MDSTTTNLRKIVTIKKMKICTLAKKDDRDGEEVDLEWAEGGAEAVPPLDTAG